MQRANSIDGDDSEEKTDDVDDEEQLVLRVDGKDQKPFYMEDLIYGKQFKAIIDIGLLVSIFTKTNLRQIIGERKVVIREVIIKDR